MQALTEAKEETSQSTILRKQGSLYRASQRLVEEGERFKNLYSLLWWKPWMQAAAQAVLSNQGSQTAGVDGVTGRTFKGNLDVELDNLMAELRNGSYRPRPVKRVYVPKPGKREKRPLGIPTIRDRIVQKAVQMILDPIYEARFEECSYGFRPNRSAIHAIAEVRHYGKRQTGYEWVIEGDIRNCFGNISHKVLVATLRKTIADRRLLSLIWKMLKAGVLEELQYRNTDIGTPQGGIVSPLLANVYMDRLDRWFAVRYHRLTRQQRYRRQQHGLSNARLIRYADDFVIMVRGTQAQAEAIKQELAQFIAQDLQMDLSEEKTLITHIQDGFDFLGYTIRLSTRAKDGQKGLYCYPSKRALQGYMRKVKHLTTRSTVLTEAEVLLRINRIVRGWANYFRYGNSKQTFSYLENWTWHRVYRWLCKMHQKVSRKAVRAKYTANCSKAVLPRQRRGHYQGLGIPVDGGWLFLEKMTATPIERSLISFRRIPSAYQAGETVMDQFPAAYLAEDTIPPGATRLEPEFRAVRGYVRQRDNDRCVLCGSTRNLDVHHKTPYLRREDQPGIHDPTNLITLCRSCHNRLRSDKRRTSSGKPDEAKASRPVWGEA